MNLNHQKRCIFNYNAAKNKWSKKWVSKKRVNEILDMNIKEIRDREFEEKVIWFR